MSTQTIYSRYEFPLGNKTVDQIFEEFSEKYFNKEYAENGIMIKGVSACISGSENEYRSVILLTYDSETDIFLKLRYNNRKDVKINSYISRIKNKEGS